MHNLVLAGAIKDELKESGIPDVKSVGVTDAAITIKQHGDHNAISSIAAILKAAGHWDYDGDTETIDVALSYDEGAVVTTTVLDR